RCPFSATTPAGPATRHTADSPWSQERSATAVGAPTCAAARTRSSRGGVPRPDLVDPLDTAGQASTRRRGQAATSAGGRGGAFRRRGRPAGRRTQVAGVYVVDRGAAEELERALELGAQDVDRLGDALAPGGAETVGVGAAHQDGPGAQRQRLGDV